MVGALTLYKALIQAGVITVPHAAKAGRARSCSIVIKRGASNGLSRSAFPFALVTPKIRFSRSSGAADRLFSLNNLIPGVM